MDEINNSAPVQKIAIIDLGSNTARLIVMEAVAGYSYRLTDQIREVVRLRKGMTSKGLSEDAMLRAFSALRLFKRFCDSLGVDMILGVATSAVREAPNGRSFIERVRTQLGLSLRILDGEQEAYYGVLGVLNEVPLRDGYVLDIGGGSAQLSEVKEGRFSKGQSVLLGALTLTDKFVENDPINDVEFQAVQAEIARQLDSIEWLADGNMGQLVGLGGTIRNLALIEAARQDYPLDTLHGFKLTRDSVLESIDQFRSLPLKKRQKISGLKSDRADIILPGAMVLMALMNRLQLEELTISASGLREGVFFEKFWGHLDCAVVPDIRRFSVLNLARNYHYDKIHANHVRYLAMRIFDQLTPFHNYGVEARVILDAAAMLHDIGTIIGYEEHDKHSQTLIVYNGLPGFTPKEIAMVGLLTRYHRKKVPTTDRCSLLYAKKDGDLLLKLAAILRLAEFLERGRTGVIDDVILTWDEDTLRFTLSSEEYPMVEMWEAQRNAIPLLERAFERDVVIDSIVAPLVSDM